MEKYTNNLKIFTSYYRCDRAKGSGKSRLDQFKLEIEALLKNGSTKTFVAKRYKTSLPNFYKWLKKKHA